MDWFGPVDFLRMPPSHHAPDSPESLLLGCDIDECPDRVTLASPLTYVDAADPPFFIQHGTRDGAVPFDQSTLFQTTLLGAGVSSTFVPLEGAPATAARSSRPPRTSPGSRRSWTPGCEGRPDPFDLSADSPDA